MFLLTYNIKSVQTKAVELWKFSLQTTVFDFFFKRQKVQMEPVQGFKAKREKRSHKNPNKVWSAFDTADGEFRCNQPEM